MQTFPVDTSRIRFRVMSEPVPHTEWGSTTQKVTYDGEPVFKLRLLIATEEGGEIAWVKFVGSPEGLSLDDVVEVEGLRLLPWSMGNRAGIAYWCDSIEAVA